MLNYKRTGFGKRPAAKTAKKDCVHGTDRTTRPKQRLVAAPNSKSEGSARAGEVEE